MENRKQLKFKTEKQQTKLLKPKVDSLKRIIALMNFQPTEHEKRRKDTNHKHQERGNEKPEPLDKLQENNEMLQITLNHRFENCDKRTKLFERYQLPKAH